MYNLIFLKEKIFQAYCQRKGVEAKSVKFLFEGKRVKETDTPKMLELEENDQIDAMIEVVGGFTSE